MNDIVNTSIKLIERNKFKIFKNFYTHNFKIL